MKVLIPSSICPITGGCILLIICLVLLVVKNAPASALPIADNVARLDILLTHMVVSLEPAEESVEVCESRLQTNSFVANQRDTHIFIQSLSLLALRIVHHTCSAPVPALPIPPLRI